MTCVFDNRQYVAIAVVLVLQVGLDRFSAMLSCVMSGLAKPGVFAESG